MINLKVLSTVAAIALLLPTLTPAASFAQQPPHGGGARGGGGHPGGGARPGGGGFRPGPGGGGQHFGGGGPRYGGGGGGGFLPGLAAGAIIGGAIASQGYGPGYYGSPAYAPAPTYYDDGGVDDGAVAVAPPPGGGDAVSYCMQTYRSYDPRSGTYLGNDGYRHPCP